VRVSSWFRPRIGVRDKLHPESRNGMWLFVSMGVNPLAPNLGGKEKRMSSASLNGGEEMVESCRMPYFGASGGVARGGRLYLVPPVELFLLRGRLGGEDGGGFDGE
jgi:hypothetical protein